MSAGKHCVIFQMLQSKFSDFTWKSKSEIWQVSMNRNYICTSCLSQRKKGLRVNSWGQEWMILCSSCTHPFEKVTSSYVFLFCFKSNVLPPHLDKHKQGNVVHLLHFSQFCTDCTFPTGWLMLWHTSLPSISVLRLQ